MQVLVAYGDAARRDRLAHVLRAAGHEVTTAATGEEALERCCGGGEDVALIERRLCALPAGELVAALKHDPVAYGTAIVLIEDGGLDADEAAAALRAGVQDFLVEPVGDGELIARVAAAGRTKELQQELMSQGRRLEALIREDPLTGLSNRRFILTQLAGMVSGARRHGRPLSVAIVDLDHFKAVNDEHGHQTGDEVLTAAVRAMRRRLRAEDQLGRLGGEEFLVLLPDTGAPAASLVADSLRTEIAGAPAPVPVTASAGVATWEGEPPEALLRRADEALYAAKRGGRDRIETAPPATVLRRT
ncbi:MAG TPA: diguanylate cyclase [Solirubrobacteraceae bacterium]|jgi:diguanylate cyclase (GGDEF)-like protein